MPYHRCPACGLTTHSVARYSSIGVCASCAAPLPFEARLYPATTYGRTHLSHAAEGWSTMVGKRADATQNGASVPQEEVAQ